MSDHTYKDDLGGYVHMLDEHLDRDVADLARFTQDYRRWRVCRESPYDSSRFELWRDDGWRMLLEDAVSVEVIERAKPAEPWWAHIKGTIVVADGIAFQRNEGGEWISNEDDADSYDELVAAYPGDGRIQHLWSPEQDGKDG